jgi:hypothetical protein
MGLKAVQAEAEKPDTFEFKYPSLASGTVGGKEEEQRDEYTLAEIFFLPLSYTKYRIDAIRYGHGEPHTFVKKEAHSKQEFMDEGVRIWKAACENI